MGSAVTAPEWTDASGHRQGEIEGVAGAACIHITVHCVKQSSADETAKVEPLAWGILPLCTPSDDQQSRATETKIGEHYLNTGRFQIPLFGPEKALRKDIVASFADRNHKDATSASSLKQFFNRKQVLAIEGSSAFVRVVDLQLPPMLQPTSKSVLDLTQLSIGPAKRNYTAVDKVACSRVTRLWSPLTATVLLPLVTSTMMAQPRWC